jgi:hypothetical protein
MGEVKRIETIGTLVRGRYGNLGRITEVIESSRLSVNHVRAPLDVVVTLEPVGPGYGHRSAWASDLKLAHPGDVGSHRHRTGCECGRTVHGENTLYGVDVRSSWGV